jgi:hypothetical protein
VPSHLFTMEWREGPAGHPRQLGQDLCERVYLRGPDAGLSGRGGGGPCICQPEQRHLSAEMWFPGGRPTGGWRRPKEARWRQMKIIAIVIS